LSPKFIELDVCGRPLSQIWLQIWPLIYIRAEIDSVQEYTKYVYLVTVYVA